MRNVWGMCLALGLLGACSSDDAKSEDVKAGSDVGTDVRADLTVPDVVSDLQPEDVATADLPWEQLPTLPKDKTFTTRYVAGAAQKVLNPDHNVFLGGFGLCQGKPEMCRYSEGIHDDLHISALALGDTQNGEVVILVGSDSVGLLLYDQRLIHQAAQQAFWERLGIRFQGERLVVSSSHRHHAPDLVGLYGTMLGNEREEEAYVKEFRKTVVEVALEAYGNLQDAQLDWGVGSAPTTSLDTCAEDQAVWTLRARTPDGGAIGTMTRWASHPTTYWDQNNAISADFVGPFRKRMEETYGGVALFINGPEGSIYAVKPEGCNEADPFPEGWQDPDLTAEDHSKVACIGFNLADQVLKSLEAGAAKPVGEAGIIFRHSVFQYHPTSLLLMMVVDTPSVPGDGIDVKDPASLWDAEFSWVTVGELNYVTTPGEPTPCFAKHAVATLEASGFKNVVVLGIAQDWMGYLLAEEQFKDPALDYQALISPGETVEPAFLAALAKLAAP